MQVDGAKFYVAESNILSVVEALSSNESNINSLKSVADSDTFIEEITSICDDLLSVKDSLETLMEMVFLVKNKLMVLQNSSFGFEYITKKSFYDRSLIGSDFINNKDSNYINYNEQEIKNMINNFIKDNPEISYLGLKLENLGEWYIKNIPTYQDSTTGKATNRRRKYKLPFGKRTYGDDCTEFIAAYMAYVSGQDVSESYSGGMYDPNGTWAKEVEKLGWKAYSTDEIEKLKIGDVLISHKGAGYKSNGSYIYSSKGEHAEIYINDKETFGWGTIQKEFPSKREIKKEIIDGHIHYVDESHDYITVYRYENEK